MVRLTVRSVRYALRAPLETAWGTLREREVLEVRLEFPDGLYGEGEAGPLEPYDGVPLPAVRAALDAYAAVLARAEPTADLLAECRVERDLPQALAAVDMALWDYASRRSRTPLARLIDPRAAREVAVNATIAAPDRAGAAAEAAAAVRDGFRCLKVKVGIGDDAGRLAAIRAAVGRDVQIRADANGAWQTVEEALANLRALAPIGLECCEEPIHGVEQLRAVREQAPMRIAMDETDAPGSGAADLVCLKVSRGGISAVLAATWAARAAGSDVYVASSFDGPLGIAAGVHTAAALRIARPCGLATLSAFEGDVGGPRPRGGSIAVASTPGLR